MSRRYPDRAKYLHPEWESVQLKCGFSAETVMRRQAARYEDAVARGLSLRIIRINRLDNPYMHAHARDTIIADILRFHHRRNSATPSYRKEVAA